MSSHYRHDSEIAVFPTQLRHVVKIHAVDTHDHCRHGHERGISGQALGDFALLQGDKGQIDGYGRGSMSRMLSMDWLRRSR